MSKLADALRVWRLQSMNVLVSTDPAYAMLANTDP